MCLRFDIFRLLWSQKLIWYLDFLKIFKIVAKQCAYSYGGIFLATNTQCSGILAVYPLYYRHQRKQHEIRNIVTELIRIVFRMNEHRSKWRNGV